MVELARRGRAQARPASRVPARTPRAAPSADAATPPAPSRQPFEITGQPRQLRRDSSAAGARRFDEPLEGDVSGLRVNDETMYRKGGKVKKTASKAKKPAKFAEGGSVGANLAGRIAAARSRMAAYAEQDRPIRRGPQIRPMQSDTNLNNIRRRLTASGSKPDNSWFTGGPILAQQFGLTDANYRTTDNRPATTPTSTPTTPWGALTSGPMLPPATAPTMGGGTDDNSGNNGNKRGGLIRKNGKTLRPVSKKPAGKRTK